MAVRGTSASQDGRYLAQEKKLLAKMTFPACFDQRVDMRKVQREVVNQWVTERITQLLGFEDDIVVSMAINLLEPKVDERLDPRQLQVALTGFLEKQAGAFMEELWLLLLSAQSNPTGIPSAILDKKKQEMQSIAQEKDKLKKVLDAKRAEVEGQKRGDEKKTERGRPRQEDRQAAVPRTERRSPGRREEPRRRSRSLQRRPRSPPRRASRRRSPSVRRRSRSLARRKRSRSPRRRSRSPRRRSPSPRQRSRSPRRRSRSSRKRSGRGRSRSPSMKRSRSRR
jgi:serine/arginine repetitive matrix protein 1